MLKVKQVAERLNVPKSTVYSLVDNGLLPCVRIGLGRGTIRVEERDLEAFIEVCRPKRVPTSRGLRHIKA